MLIGGNEIDIGVKIMVTRYSETRLMRQLILLLIIFALTELITGQETPTGDTTSTVDFGEYTSQGFYVSPEEQSIWRIDWITDELFVAFSQTGVWVYRAYELREPPQFLKGNGTFSPDGRLWATQSVIDGEVVTEVFDVEAGDLLSTLNSEKVDNAIRGALAFSPDSSLIATAYNGRIELWPFRDSEAPIRLNSDYNYVVSLDFNSNGKLLASADHIGRITVWDIESRKPVLDSYHHHNATRARFNSTGNMLITSSVDRSVGLWDVNISELLFSVNGHSDLIYGLLSEDGTRLFIGDASVRNTGPLSVLALWDIEEKSRIAEFTLPDDGIAFLVPGYVEFSSSGETTAFWTRGMDLLIINNAVGEVRHTLETDATIQGAMFSPIADDLLVIWNETNTVEFWNVETGEFTYKIQTEPLMDVIISPDGNCLITAHTNATLQLWCISSD